MTVRAGYLLDDDRGSEFRRWSLAALIVFAAHLGLMGTYFLFYTPHPAGHPEGPAILIDLSPPAAPASPKDADAGPVQEEEAPPPDRPPVWAETSGSVKLSLISETSSQARL